jgi:iron complex transport system ATP-binding protein
MAPTSRKRIKPPVLEISRLRIERGTTTLIDDISWRVAAGEHWVVLGSNGSGKTSLLSALTGYLMPTEGEMSLLGERYGESDWRELRKRIGLVSSSIRQLMAESETALEAVVTGKYAMIDHWGAIEPADRKQGLRILRDIECGYLADRPWIYLSQGERQRVMIGRALMSRPKLLILDEPCAGLDPAAREHFLQFLQRLGKQRNAPTLMLVTHHVEEIMPVFSHVMILKDGGVLAAGGKTEMLTSQLLSKAFDSRVRLKQTAGRYALTVTPTTKSVM